MKASVYILAWAAALVAAAHSTVAAQTPPANGRVLVLDNGNILEGEIERQGDMYVIRRPLGELKVPLGNAAKVCASLDDAYKFLCSRANLRDPDEHLRLARWCQSHGLHEQAVAEARTAAQLRPEHAESKQYLAMLERTGPPAPVPPTPPTEMAQAPIDTAPVEVTSDCLAAFANKIQPILMNTCANCHATGKGGTFVLSRAGDIGLNRTTQNNLSATIKQISFEQPGSSPLLNKACSAHGGSTTAAITNRQAVPFVTLQSWIEMVVIRNPHLKPQGTVTASATTPLPAPAATQKTPAPSPFVLNNQPPHPPAETPIAREVPAELAPLPGAGSTPNPRPVATAPSPVSPAAPARALAPDPANADPANPYDATEFNLKWHSQTQGR